MSFSPHTLESLNDTTTGLERKLEAAQAQTLHMLRTLNRTLLVVSLMGLAFVAALVPVYMLMQSPQEALHTQAFEINYGASQHLADEKLATDPNWDGAVSGMSLGFVYLRSIPVIGVVLGPAIGGITGYLLDCRI